MACKQHISQRILVSQKGQISRAIVLHGNLFATITSEAYFSYETGVMATLETVLLRNLNT